jgi:DNA polymerase-3 subunit delta
VEGNLLAANQEIEKLALQLEKGRITEEDIRRIIVDSSRFDVYKLLDAVLEGDSRRSLKILNGLKQEGVEVLVILCV